MKDRRAQLKVKIKSLAEEARIIRLEERRAKARGDYRLFWELQAHRCGIVREKARESQVAYGLVRNRGGFAPEEHCRKDLPESLIGTAVRFGPVRGDGESEENFDFRLAEWKVGVLNSLDMRRERIRLNVRSYNNLAPERAERRRNRRAKCEEAHAQRRTLPASERMNPNEKMLARFKQHLDAKHAQ